jgi:hypothetical protein
VKADRSGGEPPRAPSDWELTERERLVLTWDKGPEEWYAEHGGQYGCELEDAERKAANIAVREASERGG